MRIAMNLTIDGHSPIPIRRQLTEQLKHAIESGGVARDQALPSIRELAGFLGINANTVARVVEDLKQSGYVEARRGKGVFVAPAPPVRPVPHLRESFLQETVIRAAALGMTADDLSVGVLSLAGVRPAAVQGTVEVLLVECSPPELDFFARQLEAHLPVRVDKVLLGGLAGPTVQVIIDDRALDQRAIEMLAAVLVRHNGDGAIPAPAAARGGPSPRPSNGRNRPRGVARATAQGK